MSLGAETVAFGEKTQRNEWRGEERRNFNDPETSPAGLEGLDATDTSLVLFSQSPTSHWCKGPLPLVQLDTTIIIHYSFE